MTKLNEKNEDFLTGFNRIGFGGGCHWCTEAVFQALRGVFKVEQGFIRSVSPDHAYSEAVVVTFDPEVISLSELIEIHLHTHASTTEHHLRNKYRSAVYAFSPEQEEEAQKILSELQTDFSEPIVTRTIPFKGFKPSENRYQNYYRKHSDQPFCERYINPKLERLITDYPYLMTDIKKHQQIK